MRVWRWLASLSWTVACAGEEDGRDDDCLEEVGVLCTVAGTGEAGFTGDGGDARDASFYLPVDVAFAPDGTLMVVDFGNRRIRAIDTDTGIVSTVAGRGEFDLDLTCGEPASEALDLCLGYVSQITFDRDGDLVIAGWTRSRVFQVDLDDGSVTHVYGTGRRTYQGEGGPAEQAAFDLVSSIAAGPDGRLFVMDQQNQVIRVVDEDGVIDRYAGNCVVDRADDGTALCEAGEEPVACPDSDKVTCGFPATTCEEHCSIDFAGGSALEMRMAQRVGPVDPSGHLAMAPDGTIYFSDVLNLRVRAIAPDGAVTTVAGSGELGDEGDGVRATTAQFESPGDLALVEDGTLYIVDPYANCIRRVMRDGTIESVVGQCGRERGFSEDGYPADAAQLEWPYGIAVKDDILYLTDTANHLVRAVRLE